MEEKKDFDLRPNSTVEFKAAEEMAKYQQDLIYRGMQMIEFKSGLIQTPGRPPQMHVNANKAVAFLAKLQQFMINKGAQVWLMGICEDLEILKEREGVEETLQKYQKALVEISHNCTILQQELGL